MHIDRLVRVAALCAAALTAAPTGMHAQASKPGFQQTVTKRMQVVMTWVKDVSEKQKPAALASSLGDLDAITLKALDQQVTLEYTKYVQTPEARTANGVRILGRFRQAQSTIRDLMAKKK